MLLTQHMRMPGNVNDNIKVIWQELIEAYSNLGTKAEHRLPTLTYNKFQAAKSKLPYLKARGIEVKCLAPALRIVFVARMGRLAEEHRDVKLLLDNCIAINEVLDQNCKLHKLPPDDADRLETHSWEYAQRVTKLKHYRPLNKELFSLHHQDTLSYTHRTVWEIYQPVVGNMRKRGRHDGCCKAAGASIFEELRACQSIPQSDVEVHPWFIF